MSSIINKVKDAVSGHKNSDHSDPEGTHGHHNSRAANAADPRIDSDRDGRADPTVGSHGTHGTHGTTGSGLTGTHGTHGTTGTTGLTGSNYNTSTNAGPHDSNAANKLDPRVDSDRDGSRTAGGNAYGSSGVTGTHGTHGTTGSGLTGTHGTHGTTGYNSSTNAGPHNSNALNAADPRVDSDRDGSRTVGGNNYGSSGVAGTHGTHGTHGVTGAHTGPGPAPNTAGPHKSDALNKLDPRVDSDRDGSKTLGQDKTYTSDAHKDPTDAAQVPPSTLRKHIGEPAIAHDDHHHGRERRNSSVTAQEAHRGL